MNKTVAIYTLGCKVNSYESEAVAEQFAAKGYTITDFDAPSDIYIINTCTVTHLGDRKSRQMIRRTKQINPESVLLVMGCYSQIAPDKIDEIPEVDIILGTGDKGRVVDIIENFFKDRKKQCLVSDIGKKADFEELSVDSFEGKSRAFLKVQDGCNNFCSYCIIPYARGRIRSRNFENCISEAKRLSENGFSEIVLVGIHLASYGMETGGPYLIDLLTALNDIDGLKRIRMGSLEPTLFDEEFTKKIAKLPKICRHFHLSMQSGCDETLARMNRKYTSVDYAKSVSNIRKFLPDAAITTDILTGFPGETDDEFETTFKFVEKIKFSDAHVFKYSIRKGTKAEKMKDQISPEVKEIRSRRLIELTDRSKSDFIKSHIGQTVSVLFEQKHKAISGTYEGKTDNYITVIAESGNDISGVFKNVIITEEYNGMAFGKIINE